MKSKKGMLGNIIGGIMVVFIGIMIVPTISQEIYNATNCIVNQTGNETLALNATPKGSTDSFGGAGGETHFGGYDGEVVHKPFLSDYAIVKTDKSVINPDCEEITGFRKTLLDTIPAFFALAILGVGVAVTFSSLRNSGVV